MRTVLTTASAMLLLFSRAALADWHEASSDHFVIYADENEKEIRKYSDRLERYYSAMCAILPSKTKNNKPSPSNRVTIYVVSSDRMAPKLYGAGSDPLNPQDIYTPRAGGAPAITPPINITGREAS